jgi:predicted DNA binding CopG/RHH family protein
MNAIKKIPRFKTHREAASFWDTHDFSDYVHDTDKADDVVFTRNTKETVSIRLEKDQVRKLKKIATHVGLGYTSLIRSWVTEKLAKT